MAWKRATSKTYLHAAISSRRRVSRGRKHQQPRREPIEVALAELSLLLVGPVLAQQAGGCKFRASRCHGRCLAKSRVAAIRRGLPPLARADSSPVAHRFLRIPRCWARRVAPPAWRPSRDAEAHDLDLRDRRRIAAARGGRRRRHRVASIHARRPRRTGAMRRVRPRKAD